MVSTGTDYGLKYSMESNVKVLAEDENIYLPAGGFSLSTYPKCGLWANPFMARDEKQGRKSTTLEFGTFTDKSGTQHKLCEQKL